MIRRKFVCLFFAGSAGLMMLVNACKTEDIRPAPGNSDFLELSENLLKEWCDGMIAVQIIQPDNPELHGALGCPASDKIHGRCMDAVYPFMYMADMTGEKKYLDAAIAVMDWSENVSEPDGSWTVIPDPKSWKGISVFGAIALCESLRHHGDVLPEEIKAKWDKRLRKVADYIYQNFTMTFSHVNYGFTSVYALHILGNYLENPKYTERSKELGAEIKNWFTEPNSLLYGEDKPSNKRSEKGLLPVDLGYNVEESLNGVVLYALETVDEELLALLEKSMESHLEFLIPDGAWDNSWGTRQYKWSYWGSRTTDGCQPAFVAMADRNPAFGTAAYLNTELLARCTIDGLIAGGPHYATHGVKPCVHHTFAHAKALAHILEDKEKLAGITKNTPVPRQIQNGVKHFSEIDVWIAGKGPWSATVSSYDNEYKTKYSQPATGGSLAVLWHEKVGLLLTASMAEYLMAEKNNQQPNPGEDYALTPRIEIKNDSGWYTNLYDLEASVEYEEKSTEIEFKIKTKLRDREKLMHADYDNDYQLTYNISDGEVTIQAETNSDAISSMLEELVIPIVSPTGEKVDVISPTHIEIKKPHGTVVIKSNRPMKIKNSEKERIFNMVPGVEVIPVSISFQDSDGVLSCSISVI